MRLWSIHPKYLDRQGLLALWRESLLARTVLCGQTRGYVNHPQLIRFKAHPYPRSAINSYLAVIHSDATRRGYRFNRSKIGPVREVVPIAVTSGQLAYEWEHLQRKLAQRSLDILSHWANIVIPDCHPLFSRKSGAIASWEKVPGTAL